MRTYVVVIDDSAESRPAVRFAARRAARTGGTVHLVAVIEPQDFVAFGAVAATIAEEERSRATALVEGAAAVLRAEHGIEPQVSVLDGEATSVVRQFLNDEPAAVALVLGAAAEGDPGPLVAHFTGSVAGALPCPVMVIPGALTDADIDRLS